MTDYERSDYGSDPHAGAPRNNASSRGWGSGWPNCQTSRQVKLVHDGIVINLRREISELVGVLLEATDDVHGYNIRGNSGTEWNTGSFACRAIRGTSTASNHSWGLAMDINASRNPMSTRFVSDIPPAVVKLWESCGFYWGGRYRNRPDAMHFEYIFKPSVVASHLVIAERALKPSKPSQPATKYETYRRNQRPASRTVGRFTTKPWSAGDDVAFLQRYIGKSKVGAADGYFGPKTEAGVRWYQGMRGITVDGFVGPVTWRHMGKR